jgi:hypothetical protein
MTRCKDNASIDAIAPEWYQVTTTYWLLLPWLDRTIMDIPELDFHRTHIMIVTIALGKGGLMC